MYEIKVNRIVPDLVSSASVGYDFKYDNTNPVTAELIMSRDFTRGKKIDALLESKD